MILVHGEEKEGKKGKGGNLPKPLFLNTGSLKALPPSLLRITTFSTSFLH
jgi:hypothetical protein